MRGSTPSFVALATGATALVLAAAVVRDARSDLPAPGDGAQSRACREHVLADWRDDGVVQGRYRIVCYRLALRTLPEDIRAYTSAADDIWSAMSAAARPDGRLQSTAPAGTR